MYHLPFFRVAWPHLALSDFGKATGKHKPDLEVFPGPYSRLYHDNPKVDLTPNYRTVPDVCNTHPVPDLDGIEDMQDNEFCGFQNLTQLGDWFGPWLDSLEYAGYRIVSYNVPWRRDGVRQSVAPLIGLQPVGVNSMYWRG